MAAALNIRGATDDKLDQAEQWLKRDGVQILELSETWEKGSKRIFVPGFTYIGNRRRPKLRKRARGGVGFLIRDDVYQSMHVEQTDAETEGVLWVRLETSEQPLHMAAVYNHANADTAGVDRCFDALDAQLPKRVADGNALMMGDLNAHMGVDSMQLPKNRSGKRLQETCSNHDLHVCNDLVGTAALTREHKSGGAVLDYVIASAGIKPAVQKCRVVKDTGIRTDHHAVIFELDIQPAAGATAHQRPAEARWNMRALTSERVAKKYENKLAELAALFLDWRRRMATRVAATAEYVAMVTAGAQFVFGAAVEATAGVVYPGRSTRKFDKQMNRLLRRRSEARQEALADGDRAKLKQVLTETKRLAKELTKSRASTIEAEELNEAFCKKRRDNNFWKLVSRKLKPEQQNVVTDDNVDDWGEQCRKLYNPDHEDKGFAEEKLDPHRQFPKQGDHAQNKMIEVKEIESAVKAIHNGKAPGPDAIYNDMLKQGRQAAVTILHALFTDTWKAGLAPRSLFAGVVVPVRKAKATEGSVLNKYRPIMLTSVIGKVLERIIHARLTAHVTKMQGLDEQQFGFQKQRSTADATFVLAHLIASRRGKPTYVAFLDISKAYDTVWRDGLWLKLQQLGVSGTMLNVLKSMYSNVTAFVRGAGRQSAEFAIDNGLRQGSVISPLLYNIFINGLVRELKTRSDIGVRVGPTIEPCCLFADDIALLATSPEALQTALGVASEYASKWRFKFGPDKSNVVVFSRKKADRQSAPATWQMGPVKISTTDKYKYLGTWLSADMRWATEADNATAAARKKLGMLWAAGLLDRSIKMATRKRIMEVMILPRLIYGAEVVSFAGNNDRSKKAWASLKRRWAHCARIVTGTNWSCNEEDALAELGWRPLEYYRDLAQLRFAAKMMNMQEESIGRRMFATALELAEPNASDSFQWAEALVGVTGKYAVDIRNANELNPAQWTKYTKEVLASYYNSAWSNSEGAGYRSVPFFDAFLDTLSPNARRILVRLRLRRPLLNEDMFRIGRAESPLCPLCGTRPESPVHLLTYCPDARLSQLRRSLEEQIRDIPSADSVVEDWRRRWVVARHHAAKLHMIIGLGLDTAALPHRLGNRSFVMVPVSLRSASAASLATILTEYVTRVWEFRRTAVTW